MKGDTALSLENQQCLENRYVMHTYARKPVEFVRGKGACLYDCEGKEYLDFLAGVGSVSVGHCNPSVTDALVHQTQTLVHASNYFYADGRGELAEKLSVLLSGSDLAAATTGVWAKGCGPSGEIEPTGETEPTGEAWKIFFANSGAEANEGAIKLARKYGKMNLNGAATIVSALKSFHGRTLAALAATGQESKQKVFAPMPEGFLHVPLNDREALESLLDAQAAKAQSADTQSADAPGTDAQATEQQATEAVCAVLLECIQGEGGVWPCTQEYLQAVRELTASRGILLIIDEVQTGFFRTGTHAFAYQHYGICPDIVTMAKGIANGVPMGAFAACGDLGDLLVPGEHGSTFGGSLLALAAANATIDELLSINAAERATQMGERLAAGLARLPHVKEVRGLGLMRAVSLDVPVAAQITDTVLTKGLVINAIGDSILRFLPPLVVDEAQIDKMVQILECVLSEEVSS